MALTAFKQVRNGAKTTLASSLLAGSTPSTSGSVATGTGTKLPATGSPFWATVWDKVTFPDPRDDPNGEIILVTARSGDNLTTIVRGQLGTSITPHSIGAALEILLLDQHFIDVYNAVNNALPVVVTLANTVSTYTITSTAPIVTVLASAATGGTVVQLPDATVFPAQIINLKKIDTDTTKGISMTTQSGQLIENAAPAGTISTPNYTTSVQSDGANWWRI